MPWMGRNWMGACTLDNVKMLFHVIYLVALLYEHQHINSYITRADQPTTESLYMKYAVSDYEHCQTHGSWQNVDFRHANTSQPKQVPKFSEILHNRIMTHVFWFSLIGYYPICCKTWDFFSAVFQGSTEHNQSGWFPLFEGLKLRPDVSRCRHTKCALQFM